MRQFKNQSTNQKSELIKKNIFNTKQNLVKCQCLCEALNQIVSQKIEDIDRIQIWKTPEQCGVNFFEKSGDQEKLKCKAKLHNQTKKLIYKFQDEEIHQLPSEEIQDIINSLW